jgi:uncharacterized protein
VSQHNIELNRRLTDAFNESSLLFVALSSSTGRRGEILSGIVGKVVTTRVQYTGPSRRWRSFEGRLIVRFPSLYRRVARLVFGLDPSSRLRQVFLRRNVVSAYAAFSRQDFEPILVGVAPDVVYEFNLGLQTLGLGGTFLGHEGMLEAFGKLAEAWESWELEPAYILDLGDRVLSLGFWRSQARTSGVPLEVDYAELATLRDGLITHHQDFFSWEEGLRAAGLDPHAIALPARGQTSKAASAAKA